MELMKQRLEKEISYILDHMDESAPNEAHYESLTRSLKNVCDVWLCFKSVQAEPNTEANIIRSTVQIEEAAVDDEADEQDIAAEQNTPAQVAKDDAVRSIHNKEDLRDILSRCSIANHNIKDLLAAFGANKLSAVQEKDYDALYDMASKLLGD